MSIKHELPPAETDWALGTAIKHLLRLATASDEYHEAIKEATERHHHENPGEMVAYRTLSGNQSLDEAWMICTRFGWQKPRSRWRSWTNLKPHSQSSGWSLKAKVLASQSRSCYTDGRWLKANKKTPAMRLSSLGLLWPGIQLRRACRPCDVIIASCLHVTRLSAQENYEHT